MIHGFTSQFADLILRAYNIWKRSHNDGTLQGNSNYLFLSIPVTIAGLVSWGIAKNIDKIGGDGWKKLYTLNKVLINFYITVFITCIIGARYVNILENQIFIALLVASATALGIKIGVDMKKDEK